MNVFPLKSKGHQLEMKEHGTQKEVQEQQVSRLRKGTKIQDQRDQMQGSHLQKAELGSVQQRRQ